LLYLAEETSSPVISLQVVGHQWYWEYQYLDSGVRVRFNSYLNSGVVDSAYHNLDVDNRVLLPVNSNILFLVRSSDVLHSWTVPRFGIKVDAVPGRLNYLSSLILNTGIYFGQCSEICGSNHSFMPVVVEVVLISDFIRGLSKY